MNAGGEVPRRARPRRVGIMGGTFDPIHHGHLSAASEVAAGIDLDEVVFVPAGRPWQKAGTIVSDAEDRYAMTVLAVEDHPRFSVSRVDIDRSGSTYTVDTLRDLKQQYGRDTELFFITGADTLAHVMTWKAVDEVFSLATFVLVNRPGYRLPEMTLPAHAQVLEVNAPELEISSTDCRRRVGEGAPLWYLMPAEVVRYIDKRGLYRVADGK